MVGEAGVSGTGEIVNDQDDDANEENQLHTQDGPTILNSATKHVAFSSTNAI